MKLLNAQVAMHPSLRSFPTPREKHEITIRDRTFVLDVNSLALWEPTSPNESIPLSTRKPQFSQSFVLPMSMVLEASNDCNFACKYCFAREYGHSKQNMTVGVAIQAINHLLGHAKNDKQGWYSIGFFGGEPLMNWNLIESIVPFARGFFNQRVGMGVTTNGSLIDQHKAEFMVKNNFSYIFSLDGPQELHDEFRIHKTGTGTFEQTFKGLECLKQAGGASRLTLRASYVPGSVHLMERAIYLNELCDTGYGAGVAIEPICITESHCVQQEQRGFTAEDAQALEPDYMAVADWGIERLKAGKPFRFRNITGILERLLYSQHNACECFTGDTKISLLNGKEEKIQDLVGKDPFWVYSYDTERQTVVPGKAIAVKTGSTSRMLEVTLDNSEKIVCTPDHPWLMRDGTYKKASELVVEDSLMPLYRRKYPMGTGPNLYEQTKVPTNGYHQHSGWRFTHQLVGAAHFGWTRKSGNVMHHKQDRFDNTPENLVMTTLSGHAFLHADTSRKTIARWNDQQNKDRHSEVSKRAMQDQLADPNSRMNKYLANGGSLKASMAAIERNKWLWKNDPDHRAKCVHFGPDNGSFGKKHTPEERITQSRRLLGRLAGGKNPAYRSDLSTDEIRRLRDEDHLTFDQIAKKLNCSQRTVRLRYTGEPSHKPRFVVNHKVTAIRELQGHWDLYDLQVERYHNFALSSGVFVHNCGAGTGYVTVGWDGGIFACHRMNWTRIGALQDGGIDEEMRAMWCENRLYRSKDCRECSLKFLCGSGCREANLGANHDINKPYTFYCAILKVFMKAAIWIMANVDTETLVKAYPNSKAMSCGRPNV